MDLGNEAELSALPTGRPGTHMVDSRSESRANVRDHAPSETVYDTPYQTDADNRYKQLMGIRSAAMRRGALPSIRPTGLFYADDWRGRLSAEDIEATLLSRMHLQLRRSRSPHTRRVASPPAHNTLCHARPHSTSARSLTQKPRLRMQRKSALPST